MTMLRLKKNKFHESLCLILKSNNIKMLHQHFTSIFAGHGPIKKDFGQIFAT